MLVIRLDLEGFLVECRGLCKKAFGQLVIGDSNELRDRVVVLPRPEVQVAERVDRVPVLRLVFHKTHVLLDRSIELSLAEQLLRLFQCRVSINCHRKRLVLTNSSIRKFLYSSAIVSNRDGGLKERRCSVEYPCCATAAR